ncbi:MAG: terminase small subunit [Pseudomonadota bacterium]|nr:terminase small subunit [Pseudomonadota bacterium]
MTDRKKPRKASRSQRGRAKTTTRAPRLSNQQARFVDEYLSQLPYNATAAYGRAGYKATGQAARTAAARLLKQPAVQAAIAEARAQEAAKFAVSRESVLAELAKIAFFDPRRLYHDDGSLKHPNEMDEYAVASLVQMETEEEYADLPTEEELEDQPNGGKLKRRSKRRVAIGRSAKVRWSDKRAALDSIIRMMGYAKDNSTLGTPENPIQVMLADMAGRKSALSPVATPLPDDEDA